MGCVIIFTLIKNTLIMLPSRNLPATATVCFLDTRAVFYIQQNEVRGD